MSPNVGESIIGMMVGTTLGVCGTMLIVWTSAQRGHHAVDVPPSVAVEEPATTAKAAPPCIKEHCYERPHALHCTLIGSVCDYEIRYEHRCDCVEWAP